MFQCKMSQDFILLMQESFKIIVFYDLQHILKVLNADFAKFEVSFNNTG